MKGMILNWNELHGIGSILDNKFNIYYFELDDIPQFYFPQSRDLIQFDPRVTDEGTLLTKYVNLVEPYQSKETP